MKIATYHGENGPFIVEYDENAPCVICNEPVWEASMGGTVVCPWCDCGNCRYCGKQFNYPISVQLAQPDPKEWARQWIQKHVAKCKERNQK